MNGQKYLDLQIKQIQQSNPAQSLTSDNLNTSATTTATTVVSLRQHTHYRYCVAVPCGSTVPVYYVVTLCLCTWTSVQDMRSSCFTAVCVGGPSDLWPRPRLMTSHSNRLHGSQSLLTHTLSPSHTHTHTHTLWWGYMSGSGWLKGNQSHSCQSCQSKWHEHTRIDYY